MREIRFRGMNPHIKDWIFGDLCTHYENEPDSVYIIDDECTYTKVKPKSICQFTGLLDKDGNEIYEGDILHDEVVPRWFNWLIKIVDGSVCLINIGVDGYQHEPMILSKSSASNRTIIGNIFQNPELVNP